MTGQLFNQPEAVYGSFGGVMEHVQPDQPGVQLLIITCFALLRFSRSGHLVLMKNATWAE